MKYAYLGPRGSNAEEALLADVEVAEGDAISARTIEDVFGVVATGEADRGIVPIENSIEGSVNATLDMLAFESDLKIEREIVWSVHHQLIVAPTIDGLGQITEVTSHPQAIGQCRKWLDSNLRGVQQTAANSTSEAVQRAVAEPGVAAIGTKLAAKLYGGRILPEDIEDNRENHTRFVVLGHEIMPRTGRDKTSVVCFIHEDRPGMLLQILSEFAFRNINLTKIQSRPTKKQLGSYCFFVDLEGHQTDLEVADALKFLGMRLRELKVLGSYPRA